MLFHDVENLLLHNTNSIEIPHLSLLDFYGPGFQNVDRADSARQALAVSLVQGSRPAAASTHHTSLTLPVGVLTGHRSRLTWGNLV